jgi:hypothetical protein
MINFIKYAAKAIAGAIVGGGVIPIASNIVSETVIWSWEYMLASAFGVGISVYLIPNKDENKG